MLIRYGYEITVTCAQPTPMVCLLSVGEGRKTDSQCLNIHCAFATSNS